MTEYYILNQDVFGGAHTRKGKLTPVEFNSYNALDMDSTNLYAGELAIIIEKDNKNWYLYFPKLNCTAKGSVMNCKALLDPYVINAIRVWNELNV